ncbi:uncharacterized protein PHA67_012747 [Liasis olivaceus]
MPELSSVSTSRAARPPAVSKPRASGGQRRSPALRAWPSPPREPPRLRGGDRLRGRPLPCSGAESPSPRLRRVFPAHDRALLGSGFASRLAGSPARARRLGSGLRRCESPGAAAVRAGAPGEASFARGAGGPGPGSPCSPPAPRRARLDRRASCAAPLRTEGWLQRGPLARLPPAAPSAGDGEGRNKAAATRQSPAWLPGGPFLPSDAELPSAGFFLVPSATCRCAAPRWTGLQASRLGIAAARPLLPQARNPFPRPGAAPSPSAASQAGQPSRALPAPLRGKGASPALLLPRAGRGLRGSPPPARPRWREGDPPAAPGQPPRPPRMATRSREGFPGRKGREQPPQPRPLPSLSPRRRRRRQRWRRVFLLRHRGKPFARAAARTLCSSRAGGAEASQRRWSHAAGGRADGRTRFPSISVACWP